MDIDFDSKDFIDYINENVAVSPSDGVFLKIVRVTMGFSGYVKLDFDMKGSGGTMPIEKFNLILERYKAHKRDKIIQNVLNS